MDKQTLLQQIQTAAFNRIITKREVLAAFRQGLKDGNSDMSVFKILLYLGAAIVGLGVIILIWQNWATLPYTTKLFATLGVGIAAFYGGVIFGDDESLFGIDQVFYLISGLVLPVGFYVLFRHLGYDVKGDAVLSLMTVILFAIYLPSFFIFRKAILMIFSIIFATCLFYYGIGFLSSGWIINRDSLVEYRFLVIGLGYLMLGHYFVRTRCANITGALYGFGAFFFLSAVLNLGDWAPHQNIFWEVALPVLSIGISFLSVSLKSKSCLVFGAIYLVASILKTTYEYFEHNLGWPIALIIAGVALIGVGYLTFYTYRKYLSSYSR